LKVEGFLRLTGFIELIVGVLMILYAQSPLPSSSCPVGAGCGGPLPDYGLYNTIGLVLVVIGLIQIAASFYIGRNRAIEEGSRQP
jgi:uncharacterized protein YjeT (DUF2065 family)